MTRLSERGQRRTIDMLTRVSSGFGISLAWQEQGHAVRRLQNDPVTRKMVDFEFGKSRKVATRMLAK